MPLWKHIYCRVCFLHCFSCSVYYMGKAWEILSSMWGYLSGVWSLVMGFAWFCHWESGHGESNRFGKLLCLRRFLLSRGVFNPPEAKKNSCGVIFCLGGLRHFFLPLVFLGICFLYGFCSLRFPSFFNFCIFSGLRIFVYVFSSMFCFYRLSLLYAFSFLCRSPPAKWGLLHF